MTLSEEFAHLLATLVDAAVYAPAERLGGPAGGNVTIGRLQETPDLLFAVTRYGGGESDSLSPTDEPRFQVRVRGPAADERVAEQAAQDVYDNLHGLGRYVMAGGTYLSPLIGVNGGPVPMGRDQTGRPEWAINFRAHIQRPTRHRP